MARSAQEWAKLVIAPLAQLRTEVWTALNEAKDGNAVHAPLTWEKLIHHWRPKEEDTRTVEARWRNGLDTDDIEIDIMDLGEGLEALHTLKDRLPSGKTPRVRRLLYDELEPAERILKILHPNPEIEQDVTGLFGTWRLVHQQSDGKGFISWRLIISPTVEICGGPGAWFKMETRIVGATPGRPRTTDFQRIITHSVEGAVHAVNAMFYLLGADRDRQLVTASFEAPRGQLPANRFDRAHGLIQRIGMRGLYAARTVLSRTDEVTENEIGSFTMEDADAGLLDGLADDIATIAASSDQMGSPPCLVNASEVLGI
jgi:hypothetical protein